MIEIQNIQELEELTNANEMVLIDFWVPWCGPCKAMIPDLEELATEYKDSVIVAKVNAETCSGICKEFGIRAVPTLLLYKNGEVIRDTSGRKTKDELVDFITV